MNGTQVTVGPAGKAASGGLAPVAIRDAGAASPDAGRAGFFVIRGAAPADRGALGEFFARLSAGSRYLRFFSPVTPGAGLLDLLSGVPADVDAVVAVRGGAIVGHAMAVDRAEDRGTTDIGVVVADAWQGRGVGSALVRALADRARARGVTAMAMDVMHANHRVLAMIAGHWPAAEFGRCRDYATVVVRLPAARPWTVSPCAACPP